MSRPDLTIRQADPEETPDSRLCKAGHNAKKTWWDPGIGHRPNRFFMVSGPKLPKEKQGLYCEECLVRANQMARAS